MRGDRVEHELKVNGREVKATAVIVDSDGRIIYRVVSTGWTKLIVALMVTMMAICTLVSLMVWVNAQKIDRLEEKSSERLNTQHDGGPRR
jgi:hypothetical protein